MLRLLRSSDVDYARRLDDLGRRTVAPPPEVEAAARAVVDDVRARGDAAVRELTARFESRTLAELELSRAEWEALAGRVDPAVRESLVRAAERIRAYHRREADGQQGFEIIEPGIRLGCRVTALARVGIYVPGGTARYPSTVLMTAVPARVAGTGEILMTTPGPSPETLAAAAIAGVDRVFVMGGAQAIAALAYGTQTVPRVDKIVGPGNAYVAAAKRLVFGDVGIESVAGPTEVVIAADDSADPAWMAADLLAQAEHDELATPILVAVGAAVADRVNAQLAAQLVRLPRRAIAARALADRGLAIVVDSGAEAVVVVNRLAPEHAQLALRGARDLAAQVTTAGALFIGVQTPEPVGDYVAGPSHVLPTGGSARFASPLGVADFLKRTSVLEYDADALRGQSADIARLAEVEGLAGHARAVAIRNQGARSPS